MEAPERATLHTRQQPDAAQVPDRLDRHVEVHHVGAAGLYQETPAEGGRVRRGNMQHIARLALEQRAQAPGRFERERDRGRRATAANRYGKPQGYHARFGWAAATAENDGAMALRDEVLPETAYMFLDAARPSHMIVDDEADFHAGLARHTMCPS